MADGEAANAEATAGGRQARRVRWRVALGIGLLLVVLLLGSLWLARKPVAEHFVDDALRARHIPASYKIAQIGFRTQRLTDVRIGDPAHPDLVADWIEVDTTLSFSGAGVAAVRVGHVRMSARLADGKVSFGMIDRLLPARSGAPFALPSIRAEIADARIALATPFGPVAVALQGSGQVDDGFRGILGATANRLDIAGCRFDGVGASLAVNTVQRRPSFRGPLILKQTQCNGIAVAQARADLSAALTTGFDRWRGSAHVTVAALDESRFAARKLAGPVTFVGSAQDLSGTVDLHSGSIASGDVRASGGVLNGRYRYAGGGLAFIGTAQALRAAAPPALLAQVARQHDAGAGTPVGPIVARLVRAIAAAGRAVDVDADVSVLLNSARGQITVPRIAFRSATGARGQLSGGSGIEYRWPGGDFQLAGDASLSGGGLPRAQATLRRLPNGALAGRMTVAPYAVDNARLSLTPVDFSGGPSGARVATRVTLSGPLGDGHVDDVALPLDIAWDGRDRLTVNRACTPLSFARVRIASLDLPRSAVTLCPRDGALVRVERGVVRGGGAIGPFRLGGKLGSAPILFAAQGAEWSLDDRRFAMRGARVQLGAADRATRLEVARLGGSFGSGGAQGTFAGAAGQIGAVPLLLSEAAGHWRFANGALGLGGTLQVADSADPARFKPLAARDVSLTLARNRIVANGTLFEPSGGVKVSDVRIAHDLNNGTGQADLAVPGITFGPAFQPDRLTPLTYGVIAEVAGTVTGEGHIRWAQRGVTSDGIFRTSGIDLAAAFGPVTGIAGEIRFTDLLSLESAPGQIATIKTINPGIPVRDGVVRYQLLPNTRIAVESGRWPLAGGTLALDPTVLDFGQAQERRMTFHVSGMAADQFLQQFDFKNLNATGIFDGTLPMIFDASGGRIEGGRLKVRPGGGTIAYVGEVTQKDVGFWGNFAFQSLKSLRYRDLDVTMNGPLAGEMITEVRFAGVGQGAGAKRNFLFDRLQKLPLVFNVRIKAPFRQLIDSAQSFYDPRRLIERNLPALLEEQNKRTAPAPVIPKPTPSPVQPSDSRNVP